MSFYFYNPVKLIHGKDSLKRMIHEIPDGAVLAIIHGNTLLHHKDLLHYLEGLPKCTSVDFYKYPESEPTEAIVDELISKLKYGTNFIIGIGGGSVMDATKAVAVAYGNKIEASTLKNKNPMDLGSSLKFGLVATKPGSGSELNNAYVLMDEGDHLKRSYFGPHSFPQFSVQDPVFYKSLKAKDYASGLTDAMSHVIDQYLVERPADLVQDLMSLNFLKIGSSLADFSDAPREEDFSKLAWFASIVSSGLLSRGVKAGWVVHEVAHSLSSALGIGHAESIALSFERVMLLKKSPLVRLHLIDQAINGAQNPSLGTAKDHVSRIVEFFKKIGMQTDINTLTTKQHQAWRSKIKGLCQNLDEDELEEICSQT